jgi:hypothetical protein
MQKFKQNGLLDNANLWFDANLSPKDIVQPVLCHLLPLINGIVSIYLMDSAQLVDFYDTGNSKEIYERNMKMMETTRILALEYENLISNKLGPVLNIYVNFTVVVILKTCTQTKLICIADGFIKRHVPMGNRDSCSYLEWM